MKNSFIKRLKKIKLLVMDVDGVLTDGKIVIDSQGRETKIFDVQDGFGIVLIRRAGLKTAILSAREAEAVSFRAKDLQIDRVYQNACPKIHGFRKLLKDFNIKENEICFIGDDLPDLSVLKRVGFAVAVKNANEELKKEVHYITKNRGGKGAVREIIEMILKAQGKWERVISEI